MPFGIVGWVGPRMCSADGGVDSPTGRGSVGVLMHVGYYGFANMFVLQKHIRLM